MRGDHRTPDSTDRQLQLAAVKRWYYSNWIRLEPRLRSSIVEGIVVFLSLFDDNPTVGARVLSAEDGVHRAAKDRPEARTRRCRPSTHLLESGKVLALNFPVGLNPGLARALGVMLKLDFQRAVLVAHRADRRRAATSRGAISCSCATSTTRLRRPATPTRPAMNARSR